MHLESRLQRVVGRMEFEGYPNGQDKQFEILEVVDSSPAGQTHPRSGGDFKITLILFGSVFTLYFPPLEKKVTDIKDGGFV